MECNTNECPIIICVAPWLSHTNTHTHCKYHKYDTVDVEYKLWWFCLTWSFISESNSHTCPASPFSMTFKALLRLKTPVTKCNVRPTHTHKKRDSVPLITNLTHLLMFSLQQEGKKATHKFLFPGYGQSGNMKSVWQYILARRLKMYMV